MKNYTRGLCILIAFMSLVSCPTDPEIPAEEDFSFTAYINDIPITVFPGVYDFGAVPVFQVSEVIEVRIENTSEDEFYSLQSWDGFELIDEGVANFIHRYGEHTGDNNSPVSPIGPGESTYLYFACNPREFGSVSAEVRIPLARNVGAENEAENTDCVLTFTGETTEPANTGDILHFLQLPSTSAASYSTPSYRDGHIYIGTSRPLAEEMADDNRFFKLTEDLEIVWSAPLGEAEVLGAAAFDSAGDLYFVTRTNRGIDDVSATKIFLKKYDGDTGAELFSRELPDFRAEIGVIYWNPAISADDVIYVGGGNLRAYNTDGILVWEYNETSNPFQALKGIRFDNEGNLYALGILNDGTDTKLHVMSFAPNRSRRWDFKSTVWGGVGTLGFDETYDRVYAPLKDTLYCLNTTNGTEVWTYRVDRDYESLYIPVAPAVDGSGNVYFGIKENADSFFYSLDSNGTLRWSFPLYGDGYPSPILGSAGVLYIGSEMISVSMEGSLTVGETFRAIDPATGAKLWGTQLSKDCCHSHPLLLPDGTLYIAATTLNTERAIIYAVKTESTLGYAPDAGNACFMDSSHRSGARER